MQSQVTVLVPAGKPALQVHGHRARPQGRVYFPSTSPRTADLPPSRCSGGTSQVGSVQSQVTVLVPAGKPAVQAHGRNARSKIGEVFDPSLRLEPAEAGTTNPTGGMFVVPPSGGSGAK